MKDHWHSPNLTVQAASTSPVVPFARLQAFELWPSPAPPPPSSHYILDTHAPGSAPAAGITAPRAAAAAADVVWRVARSEVQCVIVLSESIMTGTSQS